MHEISNMSNIKDMYKIAGLEGLLAGGVNPYSLWNLSKRYISEEFAKANPYTFSRIVEYYIKEENECIEEIMELCKLNPEDISDDSIKTYIEQSATGTVPLKISFAVPKATTSADSSNKQPTDPVVLLQNILSRLLTMGTDEYPVVTIMDTDLTNNRVVTLPEGIGTEW